MRNSKGQFIKGNLINQGRSRPDLLGNTFCVGRIPWNKGMEGYNAGPRTSVSVICKVCNKSFFAYQYRLKKGSQKCCGSPCGNILRSITCSKNKGNNHYRWIKDRNLLKDDHRDRGGQLHREWSNSVKKRDEDKCKINNSDCCGRLEAHHILGWTEFPKLRYNINNGITLCHFHHPRKREDEKKLSPYFQQLVAGMK